MWVFSYTRQLSGSSEGRLLKQTDCRGGNIHPSTLPAPPWQRLFRKAAVVKYIPK